MLKSAMVISLVLAVIVCCMGQTFQYSRGWTNGKRADSAAGDSSELIIDADWEKKFEKCVYMLQRFAQIPYLKFALMMANRKFAGHHHHLVPAGGDDSFGAEPIDTRLNGQVNGIPI